MRLATTTAVLALCAAGAQAQITGESHSYTIDGTEFEGYVARNSDLEESRGTVLIVHDWDGLTDYERRRADMLAAAGYTAFAIDVYGADTDPQGMEDYQRLSGEMYQDRETFRARLLGAVEEAGSIEGAPAEMVMIGYCFGGAAVLEAARAGAETQGFVSFHGGLGTPEGQTWEAATGPIQFYHGTADPVSGPDALAATLTELQEAGIDHEAQIFGGARHSFTVWGSDDYMLEADTESWDGLLDFLDATF
ncbi:dienelactone hydrolase family protein [Histidinibacterium aquaticum]|uniref:Dienelactone hydrolase family protein n=1 Tax=Histidinibacterium aquaticum TaxID=2613962 RepID=A0A5J5GL91_9RHOB|nr:dienelactone hydrolase family protein [Histidinibacterium aquaticum]KAA9009106.1 dienelactone hydrolase family protein [Histidinibacterium aquaticum]